MISRFFYFLSVPIILFASCIKNDIAPQYTTFERNFDEITINDIVKYNDSIFFFVGENNENEGVIGRYNKNSNDYTEEEVAEILYGISISSEAIWVCGANMYLYKSLDDGSSWDRVNSFLYFWDVDISHLKEIYAIGNKPILAIGTKHMLNGNFYNPNPVPHYPFQSTQLQMGVNDMLVIDSTDIYIAGYGSILHVNGIDTKPRYCDIGGENFTGITIAGQSSIATCTFSGNIYIFNTIDSVWKKEYEGNIKLQHIIGDTYGNILAFGDKRYMLASNDHGDNWTRIKYPNAQDVTCVTYFDNHFYIGTSTGQIMEFERKQLE
ncbi:MAG: hypothetical protein ACOCWB_04450 [Bacteroidota bacterium]